MDYTRSWRAMLLLVLLTGLVKLTGCLRVPPEGVAGPEFSTAFRQFLHDYDYSGGAVAAMKDGNLVTATAFGTDRSGKKVSVHSKFHLSSIAKSLTGVAIIKLVQEGRITLEDKVFGDEGILGHIQAWRAETVDPRLYLITVDHLLRHSCGWDVDQPPLYDPILNKLYLKNGHDVPDIARHMGLDAPIEPEELISYIMSQPMAFDPGSRTAYSNMAYLVLGRVVEAATQLKYKDFVEKYILIPCGMWNTKLYLTEDDEEYHQSGQQDEEPLYKIIDVEYADSAIGWFSNVYDLMRFTRCTFDTSEMLDDRHLELLVARSSYNLPDSRRQQRSSPDTETWLAAGFNINSRGIVWQDSDQHADDLILYHDLRPPTNEEGEDLERDKERERLPESWVILLYGKNVKHIRHYSRDLMTRLLMTPTALPTENLFLYDLSDFHSHKSWEPVNATSLGGSWGRVERNLDAHKTRLKNLEITVKYQVNVQHLSAYVDAVRKEGFDVYWFTSLTTWKGETTFLIVGRRVEQPVRAQYDFVFHHGLDHRNLLKTKLWLEHAGYNLTQLHSYTQNSVSRSSRQRPSATTYYAAVFRYEAYVQGMQMKYGTGHLPEPYHKLVQMYEEKQFYPVSQTVTWTRSRKHEEFAFVFIKRADPRAAPTDFRQHSSLSVSDLGRLATKYERAQLRLAYLNAYSIPKGGFRFSAVFTNTTQAHGILETGHLQAYTSEITIANLHLRRAPRFLVPYIDSGKLKYVSYFEDF